MLHQFGPTNFARYLLSGLLYNFHELKNSPFKSLTRQLSYMFDFFYVRYQLLISFEDSPCFWQPLFDQFLSGFPIRLASFHIQPASFPILLTGFSKKW